MIGFEEKFEVSLQLSEQEFSAFLLSIAEVDLDELSLASTSTQKPYRGQIKFNRFKLIPVQGFFKKTYGQIVGEFGSKSGKLLVKGSVISNNLMLIFVIGFTIISFVMLAKLLISNSNEELAVLAVGIFFLTGVFNLIGISRSLKSQKSDFLNRLELIVEEETQKS